jgi:hypothetical protein
MKPRVFRVRATGRPFESFLWVVEWSNGHSGKIIRTRFLYWDSAIRFALWAVPTTNKAAP